MFVVSTQCYFSAAFYLDPERVIWIRPYSLLIRFYTEILLCTLSRNHLFTSLNNYQAKNTAKNIHFSIMKLNPTRNQMMKALRLVSCRLFWLSLTMKISNESLSWIDVWDMHTWPAIIPGLPAYITGLLVFVDFHRMCCVKKQLHYNRLTFFLRVRFYVIPSSIDYNSII